MSTEPRIVSIDDDSPRHAFRALDLEHLVLGSIMDPGGGEAWDAVSDLLTPACFTGPVRPAIYETVAAFWRERIPVDPVIIVAALEGQHSLDRMGASAEAMTCVRAMSSVVALVEHAAKQLRNLWALRESRRVASGFLQVADIRDADTAIDRLQRDLSSIETGRAARVQSAGDLVLDLQRALQEESERKPGTEVISTGFPSLDKVIGGFEAGIFQLYCARPGGGKSSIATGMAARCGERGVPAGVFWLEDAARMFALRCAAYDGQIPTRMLRHGSLMHAPWWDRLAEAQARVARWPLYVEATKGLTGKDVARRIRKMHREKGIRVCFTDHLGEMALDRAEHGDRTDLAIGDNARWIRDECDRLGICPVAFHQLSQKAESEGGEPRLGWIFNSDVLGQAGRVVGFITRKKDVPDRLYITFVKATYAAPRTGVALGWDPETMRVYEAGEAQQSFA